MKKTLTFFAIFFCTSASALEIPLKVDSVIEEMRVYIKSPTLLKGAMCHWAGFDSYGGNIVFKYEATPYCLIATFLMLVLGMLCLCLFLLKKWGGKAENT